MLKIASLCALGVICLAIFVMHIICSFVSSIGKNRQKLLEYVNIAFHILMLVPLFLLGLSIEIAVLFFMASVFIHTLFGAISYKLKRHPECETEITVLEDIAPANTESNGNDGEVSV